METIIFRVLVAVTGLFLLDLLICGFAFGFPVFLALSASVGLLFWMYHRLVIRQQQAVVCRWEYFGTAVYRMEVA